MIYLSCRPDFFSLELVRDPIHCNFETSNLCHMCSLGRYSLHLKSNHKTTGKEGNSPSDKRERLTRMKTMNTSCTCMDVWFLICVQYLLLGISMSSSVFDDILQILVAVERVYVSCAHSYLYAFTGA